MRIPELWRTTTFRLTTLYGAVFAVGVLALLGLVYWRTADALTRRVDRIIATESSALARTGPEDLPRQIRFQVANDVRRVNYYGLFSRDRIPIAGNITGLPPEFVIDGRPHGLRVRAVDLTETRASAERLPWGEILVVGRDVTDLREVRTIILTTLLWSGGFIAVAGIVAGTALSLSPLRRLRALQGASHEIMAGALATRMPIAGRHDELDLFAGTVNLVMDEIERLMGEVKSVTDAIAHDLRTPLTRVRAAIYRLGEETDMPAAHARGLAAATADLDTVLDRFRALLRISELESRERRADFSPVDLQKVILQIVELYEPLAEELGVRLAHGGAATASVLADERLVFEALSNLVDNALKFTPAGGSVTLSCAQLERGPQVTVTDSGPGIATDIRQLVMQRFYRGPHEQPTPGSGLGLSIVAAIVRLHRVSLEMDDARPGLEVRIGFWPPVSPEPSRLAGLGM